MGVITLEEINDKMLKKADSMRPTTKMMKYPIYNDKKCAYRTYSINAGIELKLNRVKKGSGGKLICEFTPLEHIGLKDMLLKSNETIIDVPLEMLTENLYHASNLYRILTTPIEATVAPEEVAITTQEIDMTNDSPEWGAFA